MSLFETLWERHKAGLQRLEADELERKRLSTPVVPVAPSAPFNKNLGECWAGGALLLRESEFPGQCLFGDKRGYTLLHVLPTAHTDGQTYFASIEAFNLDGGLEAYGGDPEHEYTRNSGDLIFRFSVKWDGSVYSVVAGDGATSLQEDGMGPFMRLMDKANRLAHSVITDPQWSPDEGLEQ